MARVALQGGVSNHPFQITINSLPVGLFRYREARTINACGRSSAHSKQGRIAAKFFPPFAGWTATMVAIQNLASHCHCSCLRVLSATLTWWTFQIFFIFSARGRGRGSPKCREGGGGGFFIENPRRGGGLPGVGAGGARGREGACGNLGGVGKIFFLGGRNPHQVDFVKELPRFGCKIS